jgi:hypothetical protein
MLRYNFENENICDGVTATHRNIDRLGFETVCSTKAGEQTCEIDYNAEGLEDWRNIIQEALNDLERQDLIQWNGKFRNGRKVYVRAKGPSSRPSIMPQTGPSNGKTSLR